jgi:lipopolysaccharide export system protein LptC
VTAREGTLSGDRENISFSGNVRAIREATPASATEEAQGPVTLTTEYLHVQPNRETADTDKPVTITDTRGTIHATGMDFDNKTKSVNFKSRVSGQLQPKK